MKQQKITCKDKDGNKLVFNTSELLIKVSVYGVLIENEKILLSPQWGDGYDIPGGTMNLHETFEECLIREFFEETGLEVKVKDVLLCETDFFVHPKNNKPYKSILAYYLCEKTGGELSNQNLEEDEKKYVQKAKWVNLSKAKNLKYYNPINNKRLIEKASQILK